MRVSQREQKTAKVAKKTFVNLELNHKSFTEVADKTLHSLRLTIYAKLKGAKRSVEFHQKAWKDLWTSDIVIEAASPVVAH